MPILATRPNLLPYNYWTTMPSNIQFCLQCAMDRPFILHMESKPHIFLVPSLHLRSTFTSISPLIQTVEFASHGHLTPVTRNSSFTYPSFFEA